MIRQLFFLPALLLAAGPVAASTYSATLIAPTNERIIARDIVWTCASGACQGATEESRPAVICQSLARRAGRIASFLADGQAFNPAELDKCNAAAPTGADRAVAAQ